MQCTICVQASPRGRMRKLLHSLAFSWNPKLLVSFLYSHAYGIPPSHSLSRSALPSPWPINQDSNTQLPPPMGGRVVKEKLGSWVAGVATQLEALCVCWGTTALPSAWSRFGSLHDLDLQLLDSFWSNLDLIDPDLVLLPENLICLYMRNILFLEYIDLCIGSLTSTWQ